ncbi:MAG: hypothetical protein ACI9QA_000463 [Methanobacteriota archaeon]|jgi:hypothetical protein
MTGVSEKLDGYAEYVARKATDEFKPSNVVNVPGVSDKRAKSIISSTIEDLRDGQERALKQQYGAVIGAVYDGIDSHADDFVHYDAFYRNYEGGRDDGYRDALVERMRRIRDALEPIVRAEADGFWEATRETYDRDEAVEALGSLFTVAETADAFSDGIVMQVTVPVPLRTKTFTYTEESVRAFDVAERYAKRKVEKEADEAY